MVSLLTTVYHMGAANLKSTHGFDLALLGVISLGTNNEFLCMNFVHTCAFVLKLFQCDANIIPFISNAHSRSRAVRFRVIEFTYTTVLGAYFVTIMVS